jgi:hypothetical protein
MRIYTPPNTPLDAPLYVDVTCVDCGKLHALSNCAAGQTCIKCGGHCK